MQSSVEQELREQLARAQAQLALEQETRAREREFHAREHEFHAREREFYRRERALMAREREQLERERSDLLHLLEQADHAAEHRRALAKVSAKLDRLLHSGGRRDEKQVETRVSKNVDGLATTAASPVIAFAMRGGIADIARNAVIVRATAKKRKHSELQWVDQRRKPRRARLQIATRSSGDAHEQDPSRDDEDDD